MYWLGVLVVSPLSGALAAWLALQVFLNVAGILFHLLGLVMGQVARKTNLICVLLSIAFVVPTCAVVYFGHWLLVGTWGFLGTTSERVVFWVFAASCALSGSLPREFAAKIKKKWRGATVPGYIESDIIAENTGVRPPGFD